MKPELSIIIPAFEEEERLGGSIRLIGEYFVENSPNVEIVVVDDGSNDGTIRVANEALASFPEIASQVIAYEPNRGKGFAVRSGLRAAKADIALFTDADLSTPISETPKLVDPIKNGEYDISFGSRALDRSLIGTHQPWRREQGGKVFNLLVRAMTGLPFWDTQCGFKAFNMLSFGPLLDQMRIDRFAFDVELLYVAQNNGLRLAEIPVLWNNDERSKVNVVRDSIKMFNEVRRIRKNARNGLYRQQ